MLPLVRSMLDDHKTKIALPKISAKVMRKIIEFCKHIKDFPPGPIVEKPLRTGKLEEIVGKWYATFIEMGQDDIFDLINASDFLGLQPLQDLGCAKIAVMMRGNMGEGKKT